MAKKKCKTCIYRAADTDPNGCDFILIKGHSRGCPVEECDRYEKGKRIGIPKSSTIPLPGTIYNNRRRRKKNYE